MNRKILISGVIGIIIVSIAYLSINGDKPMEDMTGIRFGDNNVATDLTPAAPVTDESSAENTETANEATEAGTYRDYSESAFSATSGTRLLFFHAPWCPQCRSLEASIQASTIPSGVTIFKVDYDSNQSLRQKYGVTIQTTVVRVDDSGNLSEKYVAYDDPSFANVAENLL